MDDILSKTGAIIAAMISGFIGFIMYDRKKYDDRLGKLENDLTKHKEELAVLKEGFKYMSSGLKEIKQTQKDIINLLTVRRK